MTARRFRWATPARKGKWHPTKRAAADAAVRAGLASRDPFTDQLYLDALASIEEASMQA